MRTLIGGALAAALVACGGSGAAPGRTPVPSPATVAGVIAKDSVVQALVGRLDFTRYKADINSLTTFGDRTQGTTRNVAALAWIEAQLRSYGYTNVTRHSFSYLGLPRENIYATKTGANTPGEMYIVSAHFDGRGDGQAADDDGSGTALVLSLARVLGGADVRTDRSVRFILWNNEETGLDGSLAYVRDRERLQGIESPAGSGSYPEPRWLGMIQHDMMLFDHGLPPRAQQSDKADVDIEYQKNSKHGSAAMTLARALLASNAAYATDYPAQVGTNMDNTDSKSFQNAVASVSLRENQRNLEIGRGTNPNWHKATDLYTTYSDADFRLGFNAAQTTLGAVSHLAGAKVVPK